jgi:hypothetical protein
MKKEKNFSSKVNSRGKITEVTGWGEGEAGERKNLTAKLEQSFLIL